MCVVLLVHHDTLEPVVVQGKETSMCPLVGVTASTSYRISLYEGHPPMAVFPWVDLSVRQEGFYKLQFHLFEIRDEMETIHLAQVESNSFQVYSAKSFPCMSASTEITETLKKNGIRVRVSKTIRTNRARATQVPTIPLFKDAVLTFVATPLYKGGKRKSSLFLSRTLLYLPGSD